MIEFFGVGCGGFFMVFFWKIGVFVIVEGIVVVVVGIGRGVEGCVLDL